MRRFLRTAFGYPLIINTSLIQRLIHRIQHLLRTSAVGSSQIRHPIRIHLCILVQDGSEGDDLYHHMHHSLLSVEQMLCGLLLQRGLHLRSMLSFFSC